MAETGLWLRVCVAPGSPVNSCLRARGVAWAEHGSHCIVDNLISRCAQRNAMTPAIDPCQQHLTRGPVSNAFTCGKAKQVNKLPLFFPFWDTGTSKMGVLS